MKTDQFKKRIEDLLDGSYEVLNYYEDHRAKAGWLEMDLRSLDLTEEGYSRGADIGFDFMQKLSKLLGTTNIRFTVLETGIACTCDHYCEHHRPMGYVVAYGVQWNEKKSCTCPEGYTGTCGSCKIKNEEWRKRSKGYLDALKAAKSNSEVRRIAVQAGLDLRKVMKVYGK